MIGNSQYLPAIHANRQMSTALNETAEREPILRELFGIDVRSLALLRIALASVVLGDLLLHVWPYLDTFYTDEGVLPKEMAQEFLGPGYWSLCWINTSKEFITGLLVVNSIAAFCMMIGFRTRMMTLICLVVVWSIQVANPLVLSGGNILLRMLLFWSVFLPLGSVWSIDEKVSEFERPARYFELSPASVAILFQVAIVYFFSGLAKYNSFWLDGVAVEHALGLEMYVKPLGEWLRGYTGLNTAVTYGVLVAELLLPLMLFVPRLSSFFRGFSMACFWLMHIGIWLTMSIGIFSITAMVAWIVFIPREFWDWFIIHPREDYDEVFAPKYPIVRTLTGIFCSVALMLAVILNIVNFSNQESELKSRLNEIAAVCMASQQFKLWGVPPVNSPRFEHVAVLNDGSEVDLFLRSQEQTTVYAGMQNNAWRRLHSVLLNDGNDSEVYQRLRMQFLNWLVYRWNLGGTEEKQVQTATFRCLTHPILIKGQQPESKKEARKILASYESPRL